jgi:hypothetical protein
MNKPGSTVPRSGIYFCIICNHEVTCVKGEPFPPCSSANDCEHPEYALAYGANPGPLERQAQGHGILPRFIGTEEPDYLEEVLYCDSMAGGKHNLGGMPSYLSLVRAGVDKEGEAWENRGTYVLLPPGMEVRPTAAALAAQGEPE